MKKPLFTVDWEDFDSALHKEYPYTNNHGLTKEPTEYLLSLLKKHGIKAIFYVLGITKLYNPSPYEMIIKDGHVIKSHGMHHYKYEEADRKPYSWLGFTGGFYFRFLPLWFIKWQVKRRSMFYIHPHDIMQKHPTVWKNKLINFKRQVGLKTARKKLEKLLQEVEFESVTSA